MKRRAIAAWFLYDWAGRSFPIVITTFVFSAYFTQGVAEDPAEGLRDWGLCLGGGGLLIALLAPILGRWADGSGRLKPWLCGASLLAIAATALLWFVRPHLGDGRIAMVLLTVAVAAHGIAGTFYNALLPRLVAGHRLGRMSGLGWTIGTVGGLVCLALCLFGLIRAEPTPFGLDPNEAEPVRASVLLAAGWYLILATPLFLLVPERGRNDLKRHRAPGGGTLSRTFDQLRYRGSTLRFLLGSLAYLTGIETLVGFGGIYAAATFHLRVEEVLLLGIGMLASAAAGALFLGLLDDRMGSRPTILLALAALLGFGIAALATEDGDLFRQLAFAIGFCLGPAEAAGRSLMARLTPPEFAGEMFGLYALARHGGRGLGILAVTYATALSESPRLGMATVLVFVAVGFLTLLTVRMPNRVAAPGR